VKIDFEFGRDPGRCFLHIKENAISLSLHEDPIYTFDRAGRLTTAVTMDMTYRRGLNNRMCVTWRDPESRFMRRTRWLMPDEVLAILQRVHHDIRSVQWSLESTDSIHDVPVAAFLPWIRRLAGFDPPAYEADAARYARVYKPVTILPPDQYLALVLQATEGCHYNRCLFCGFYRDRAFRIKTADEFRAHLDEVLAFLGEGVLLRKTVFLADANALSIPQDRLVPLLDALHQRFAFGRARAGAGDGACSFDGISSFMDVFSGEVRSVEAYRELGDRHVRRLYLGVESGCAELLHFLRKPQGPEDVVGTVGAIKAGGLNVGIILMLGIGGVRYDSRHVEESLELVSALPLDGGDRVFLSEFVAFPEAEYPAMSQAAGIRPLTPEEIDSQREALTSGIRHLFPGIKVASYNAEEFLY